MGAHRAEEPVQLAGCALLKSLAWGRRTPHELQKAKAVGAIVVAMRGFRRSYSVMSEACKALENLCRNQDEVAEKCRREACREDVLRMLLGTLKGKLEPLIPYNLVHELYHTEPAVADANLAGDDALGFEELQRLNVWYSKVVRQKDKSHM